MPPGHRRPSLSGADDFGGGSEVPSYDLIPTFPYLTGQCQRFSNIGVHSPVLKVWWRVRAGLGIRSRLRAVLGRDVSASSPAARFGSPSCFTAGEWVRVRDADAVRQTLDARSRLRGLEFGEQQWFSCGHTFLVSKVVRRIIDDGGSMRAVSGTVLLDDVHCGGEHDALGCARRCPMMYRDEWLEAASPPPASPLYPEPPLVSVDGPRQARVKSIPEIEATLDPLGRRGGLLFMPAMARYAGERFTIVKRLYRGWELEGWVDVREPVFILDSPRCAGEVLREAGPCDRACHLLWHGDWLEFERQV
jgi:hypothetical protein